MKTQLLQGIYVFIGWMLTPPGAVYPSDDAAHKLRKKQGSSMFSVVWSLTLLVWFWAGIYSHHHTRICQEQTEEPSGENPAMPHCSPTSGAWTRTGPWVIWYLQDVDKDHGVGDVPVELLLLGHVRQVDEGPGHDAGAAVEEQLEVEPLADARVELNAHHVVVDEVTREFAANDVMEILFQRWSPCWHLPQNTHQSAELVGNR